MVSPGELVEGERSTDELKPRTVPVAVLSHE
jgi:hypothetical protein